jgi:phytoene dehydrogenase-like protein
VIGSEAIGLERFGVEWIDTLVMMVHPLPEGRDIALHRDVDATVASFEAVRPRAGHAWADLVGPLLRHKQLVRKVALSPLPPVAPALALAVRLRRSGIELARLMAGSAATFGQRILGGDEPAAYRGRRPPGWGSPDRAARETARGGSMEVDQQLVFRPVLELARYRTPLRGLSVASASVHPGPGVHGVCGAGAARAVQADASWVRPWRGPR